MGFGLKALEWFGDSGSDVGAGVGLSGVGAFTADLVMSASAGAEVAPAGVLAGAAVGFGPSLDEGATKPPNAVRTVGGSLACPSEPPVQPAHSVLKASTSEGIEITGKHLSAPIG